jgi:putative thioredoxin
MSEENTVVIEVGDADFEEQVLARSSEIPVVVDFWAPWCGPCRALGPILERVAQEHADEVVLVRVNVDEAPGLSQGLGIRSVPTVLAFRDGALVSEFAGAQPEPVVRQLFEAVLPTEADRLARAASDRTGAGDLDGAEARLREALTLEARHPRALLALARLLADRDETEEAEALLERMSPSSPLAAEAERLAAELRTRETGDADEASLRARLESAPDELEARIALGHVLAARQSYEDALEHLLEAVRRDPDFDEQAARRAMLDIFAVLGTDHALTERFRGELARALFR